jgi:hypothetical protein
MLIKESFADVETLVDGKEGSMSESRPELDSQY